ncbi:MAG: peptidase M14 [Candidimonas sp.]|nr:MAG: peptidase M14 [Candidimonas sp.]TAM25170.1 MAG: peptidase M14 [Candidimonas sp.]
MQILLDQTFPRTAEQCLRQLSTEAYRHAKVKIWLFEDLAKRQALQAELAATGVQARVFSAYKPLLHFFLEEVDAAGLQRVRIEYPRHPACVPNRFLLESYPLTGLLPNVDIQFAEGPDSTRQSYYQVALAYADRTEDRRIFAPNVFSKDFLGLDVYAPSAWLKVTDGAHEHDAHMLSEYQQAFHAAMAAIVQHDWGRHEPYFNQLHITMSLPGIERALSYGHERLSTTEAMHEDIYFSLLEFFQQYSGRAPGNRGLQPGQIVPGIHLDNRRDAAHVKVMFDTVSALQIQDAMADSTPPDRDLLRGEASDLALVDGPLAPALAERALQNFTGTHFTFASRQGRAVTGVHHQGARPAVLISGAQHANETSGVVGAVRAAQQLQSHPDAHFVLVPIENPDGYAMHQSLCSLYPTHMHHAARYTALGDDLEYREHAPWFERDARNHAFEASCAQLHLNLHGYPSHEWTRPCTGYVPRGFELWSLPKGFFLILRYRPAYKGIAARLLEHVMQQLSFNADLIAYNAEQLQYYRRYAASAPFQVQHGIPYTTAEALNQPPGVTLITEFPDETIYGDDFIFAHTVQMQTVVLATEWWWENFGGTPK